MEEMDQLTWMQTASGVQFWPTSPRVDDIKLEDIAHALAMQVRFAGHAPAPYTVAQHSVLVSERAYHLAQKHDYDVGDARDVARCGLMHDATEAYLVDLPRPVKILMPDYQEAEEELMKAIEKRFDLPRMPKIVKLADEDLLVTEAYFFFPVPERPATWGTVGDVFLEELRVWSHAEARERFLIRAAELGFN